jgi:DNA-binding NarL/FixJ family response regulator
LGASVSARIASRVTTDFEAIDRPERLSRREIETLRLMAGGHSNRDIADAFGTAEGTVRNHVSSIVSKLGVKSRTQAVLRGWNLAISAPDRLRPSLDRKRPRSGA